LEIWVFLCCFCMIFSLCNWMVPPGEPVLKTAELRRSCHFATGEIQNLNKINQLFAGQILHHFYIASHKILSPFYWLIYLAFPEILLAFPSYFNRFLKQFFFFFLSSFFFFSFFLSFFSFLFFSFFFHFFKFWITKRLH